jgi:hypothetical protein
MAKEFRFWENNGPIWRERGTLAPPSLAARSIKKLIEKLIHCLIYSILLEFEFEDS